MRFFMFNFGYEIISLPSQPVPPSLFQPKWQYVHNILDNATRAATGGGEGVIRQKGSKP